MTSTSDTADHENESEMMTNPNDISLVSPTAQTITHASDESQDFPLVSGDGSEKGGATPARIGVLPEKGEWCNTSVSCSLLYLGGSLLTVIVGATWNMYPLASRAHAAFLEGKHLHGFLYCVILIGVLAIWVLLCRRSIKNPSKLPLATLGWLGKALLWIPIVAPVTLLVMEIYCKIRSKRAKNKSESESYLDVARDLHFTNHVSRIIVGLPVKLVIQLMDNLLSQSPASSSSLGDFHDHLSVMLNGIILGLLQESLNVVIKNWKQHDQQQSQYPVPLISKALRIFAHLLDFVANLVSAVLVCVFFLFHWNSKALRVIGPLQTIVRSLASLVKSDAALLLCRCCPVVNEEHPKQADSLTCLVCDALGVAVGTLSIFEIFFYADEQISYRAVFVFAPAAVKLLAVGLRGLALYLQRN